MRRLGLFLCLGASLQYGDGFLDATFDDRGCSRRGETRALPITP